MQWFWWWLYSKNWQLVELFKKSRNLNCNFQIDRRLTIEAGGVGKGAEGNMDWNNTCQTSLETYYWSSLFKFATYCIYYFVNWNVISYSHCKLYVVSMLTFPFHRIRLYKSTSRGSKMDKVYRGIPDAKDIFRIYGKGSSNSRRIYMVLQHPRNGG